MSFHFLSQVPRDLNVTKTYWEQCVTLLPQQTALELRTDSNYFHYMQNKKKKLLLPLLQLVEVTEVTEP